MANRNGPAITYGDFEFDPIRGFPVPQISLNTTANRSSAGLPFNYQTDVTLNGLIYGFTGYNNDCESPSQLDQNTGFGFLVDQAKELQAAFLADNQELLVSCAFDGGGQETVLLSGGGSDQILQVTSIQFNESQDLWAITVPYTITLQIISRSDITGSGSGYPPDGNGFLVSSITDSLTITPDTDKSYYVANDSYPTPNPQSVSNNFNQTIINGDFNNDATPYYNASIFPTYTVTRSLSANGLSNGTGIGDSIKNAKEWCLWQATYQPIESLTSDLNLYNFVRTINADATAGSYSISDTYKAIKSDVDGNPCEKFLETFEISQDTRNDGTKSVTIQGTIEGLEVTIPLMDCNTQNPANPISDPSTDPAFSGSNTGVLYPTHSGTEQGAKNTKYNNALSGWIEIQPTLYSRCMTINPDLNTSETPSFASSSSPYWLNPTPMSQREGFSPAKGTISYNASFDNRPLSLVPEANGERLDVSDNFSVRSTANIFVIGRRLGPIKQDLGSYTQPSRRVSYSARFPKPISMEGYAFPPNVISNIYNALSQFDPNRFNAINGETYVSVLKSDSFQYSPIDASVSVTLEWEYNKCGTPPSPG